MRVLLAPALALLLAAGVLAGCGKKGPPDPPGPPEKVFWPRTYPSPTPPQR